MTEPMPALAVVADDPPLTRARDELRRATEGLVAASRKLEEAQEPLRRPNLLRPAGLGLMG